MRMRRIRLLLGLDIHDGKFSDFEAVAQKMVAVSEKEPGTLCYEFLLSADRKHCRLVEVYTDVAAITAHFKGPAVQQFVPQLFKVSNLVLIEMYGDPGPEVTAMAAALNPAVFTAWHGFDR
jgi:quinol monooxygenase YgiN